MSRRIFVVCEVCGRARNPDLRRRPPKRPIGTADEEHTQSGFLCTRF